MDHIPISLTLAYGFMSFGKSRILGAEVSLNIKSKSATPACNLISEQKHRRVSLIQEIMATNLALQIHYNQMIILTYGNTWSLLKWILSFPKDGSLRRGEVLINHLLSLLTIFNFLHLPS